VRAGTGRDDEPDDADAPGPACPDRRLTSTYVSAGSVCHGPGTTREALMRATVQISSCEAVAQTG
jgi:hypothetical protein